MCLAGQVTSRTPMQWLQRAPAGAARGACGGTTAVRARRAHDAHPHPVGSVDVGAPVEEQLDDLGVPAPRGKSEAPPARLRDTHIRARARLDQPVRS